ncbi:MAG: class I SAM-dependent methyltransferase [Nitrospira sp.]|nr:class I SAM-dependent methyltransferase [Nitrospira sp.]
MFEPFEHYLQYYGDTFYSKEVRGERSEFYALDVTRDGLPLEDNSVDVVFHEDFLEHLDQRSQVLFLAEMLRVLKPGGIHRVNTPDLIQSMLKHSTFSRGAAGVYVGEWDKHGHKNVLTAKMLLEMAMMVGYREINFTGRDGSASPLLPNEYRPDPHDREEDGNIFADLIK